MTLVPDSLPAAARERVVTLLTRRYAEDEMTEADFEARLQRVFAATSPAELDAIVADLPASPSPSPSSGAVAGRTDQTDKRITAFFSGQERNLTGVVPRALELHARLGYVELDLTHAEFQQGVTTIDVRALMGYVQIRLPAHVRVESTGRAMFGYFALKGSRARRAAEGSGSGAVVVITGRAAFGFAEIKIASKSE